MGSFFSNAFQGAVDGIHNVFSGIGDWFSGLFSNIHIALPHFSINGSFSLAPPSIPTIGVDWYANGGILKAPTVFGAIGNTLLAGGEAGPEAVAPISELQKYLGNSGNTYNFNINGATATTTINNAAVLVDYQLVDSNWGAGIYYALADNDVIPASSIDATTRAADLTSKLS